MIASQPEHPGFHQTLRKNLAQQALSAWKNLPAYLPLGLVLLALVLAAFALVAVVIALAVFLPMRYGLKHLEALEVH